MVKQLDTLAIVDGIKASEVSRYIREIILRSSSKCETQYLKITLEAENEDDTNPVRVSALVSKNRIVGEQIEGDKSKLNRVVFTLARVECLSPAEFARELSKSSQPTITSPRYGESEAKMLADAESSILKYLGNYLDARLGMKLVNDPFWYTRLLMKANLVYEEQNADLNKLLETIKYAMKSYRSALITLTGQGKELRVYVSGSRVGIGYIEGSTTEFGPEALRRASTLKGKIRVYVIKSRIPTLTL